MGLNIGEQVYLPWSRMHQALSQVKHSCVRTPVINKLPHTKGGIMLLGTVLNGSCSLCEVAVTILFQ